MQQITRGDYLEDFMTIYLENNTDKDISEIYETLVLQCGSIQKFYQPVLPIKVSLNEQDSLKLQNTNVAYLAGITKDGHKETFNGSVTFNTRGEVVFYEPPASTIIPSGTSESSCDCKGIKGYFSTCCQPAIKAYFVMNWKPEKLSQLQNDTDFQDSIQVAESISIHNSSTEAHPYIQGLIENEASIRASQTEALEVKIDNEISVRASQTEALAVSIQAESTARDEAISLAISTTEAYADSSVSIHNSSTEAHPYIQSVITSATTEINTTIGGLENLDTAVKSSIVNAINSEVSARESADNNLQGQIDALAAASDVTDIVGTYAELQAYDTQHLNNNDIIKVLSDETHDDEPSYYRFNKTAGTFSYIGSESAAYTKAQSDSIFVTQTTEINGHALSSDINLTPSDIGALADSYATVISANTSAIAANTTAIAGNTSVIAQHTTAIASNTTAIASNTSAISTINGKIPTDASTSNKLVSASALAASIADFANQDLSNLTSNGEARLHALKAYADSGELLSDEKGLECVTAYSHSTFDKSKFTVVGNPTITEDGILKNISKNSFVKGYYPALVNADELEINFKLKLYTIRPDGNQNFIMGWDPAMYGTYSQPLLGVDNAGYFRCGVYGQTPAASSVLCPINQWVYYKIILGSNRNYYDYYYSLDNKNWVTIKENVPGRLGNETNCGFALGDNGWKGNAPPIVGEFDLKYFSIKINGQLWFGCNKTGIDTIKPDNYTVVGTPTISADGVASGFSNGNYLRTTSNINFSTANSWEVISPKFKTTINSSRVQYIICKDNTSSNGGDIFTIIQMNGHILMSCVDTNWSGVVYSSNATKIINPNNWYQTKVEFTGTQYEFYYKENDSDWISYGIVTGSTISLNASYLDIGQNSNNYFMDGFIDLNAFKIYVDGKLVYQPCLKIPYTESKTGSKIVDSIYRDRVADMSAQFGFAPYYTLSDTDFTLPQVELYGLIGQRTLRDSYRNGINYWELYSNRDLEQGGSCTSGVEVTFPRPFADTNYVLSVPYSAKSATTFTPTQTGDWIAKGKGVL